MYASDKYEHVKVLEVTLTAKDKMIFAKVKISLVFKGDDGDFIEDVFLKKVETGKLSANLLVIKGSGEFEVPG